MVAGRAAAGGTGPGIQGGARPRVVVAMSGGVDSSVAAALLVEQGYNVTGVMMRLWAEEENRCCAPEAVEDARRVAAQLGIPLDVVDCQALFRACVVDYFVEEYARGRTPNPCLVCNRHVRFGHLLGQVVGSGADYMATGHYARIDRVDHTYRLLKGVDPQKDQSYVLYMLGQGELAHLLFPLGGYPKKEVRDMARARGLHVAERDESMELCFVADDDYRRFLREHAPEMVQPGPIVDTAGREIGRHQGLPFYTIGQRRRLGVAAAEAFYVIRLDTERNALIVGTEDELGRRRLTASRVSYVTGDAPAGAVRVEAKIRYRATLAPATWEAIPPPAPPRGGGVGARARVEFDAPLRDITPGQAVVAYQGDAVLGGGIIEG